MGDAEERIIEQRTVEAMKKKLMGKQGKLGVILTNLGEPIISNSGGGLYDSTAFGEDWDEEFDLHEAKNPNELLTNIPTMHVDNVNEPNTSDEDDLWANKPEPTEFGSYNIGWIFNGLNRGMHLEIKYIDHVKELTVHYKGFQVYNEVSSELKGYAPLDEWENWVNSLYKAAQAKSKSTAKEEKKEMSKEAERQKKNWLEKLRLRWGI